MLLLSLLCLFVVVCIHGLFVVDVVLLAFVVYEAVAAFVDLCPYVFIFCMLVVPVVLLTFDGVVCDCVCLFMLSCCFWRSYLFVVVVC